MRKPILIILLVLAVFVTVKYDLMTMAKIGLANFMYGQEMRSIDSFLILAEITNLQIEQEGLTRESIRETLAAQLEKAGVRSLSDELWEKTPGKPSLVVWVNAVQQPDQKGIYQYMINIAVTKKVASDVPLIKEKDKILWSTSELGKGKIEAIRKEIIQITDKFLKAHSGS